MARGENAAHPSQHNPRTFAAPLSGAEPRGTGLALLEREVSLAPAAPRLRGPRRPRRSRLEPGGERARTLRIPMLIPLDHELRQFINGTVLPQCRLRTFTPSLRP